MKKFIDQRSIKIDGVKYISASEASKKLNIPRSTITYRANSKACNNYKWLAPTLVLTEDEYIKRFKERFTKKGKNECWEWDAGRDNNGYGMFTYEGKRIRAHVFSYETKHGRGSAKDCLICHSCDNPPCCNPNHLFKGTYSDNSKDMVYKNRHKIPRYKGEKCGNSKLTENKVRRIRKMLKEGINQRVIAKQFEISQANVSDINLNKIWVK